MFRTWKCAAALLCDQVSQIRIAKDFHRIDLTVGAELNLAISFYDILGKYPPITYFSLYLISLHYTFLLSICFETGLPFHEAYDVIPFNAETNYRDIVSINVTRKGNGNIHLKVWCYLLDYWTPAVVQLNLNATQWEHQKPCWFPLLLCLCCYW